MGQLYDNAMEIAQRIRSRCDRKVDLCVILGSGLGAFVDALENAVKERCGNAVLVVFYD